MSFMIATHKKKVTLKSLQSSRSSLVIAPEIAHKTYLVRIMPGMPPRSPIQRSFIRKSPQIPRLHNEIDALTRFFLPASTQLEAEFDVAVKIGEDGNVDR